MKYFIKSVLRGAKHEMLGPSDDLIYNERGTAEVDTCYVLGNGPSLQDVDVNVLDKFPSFGTNGIFLKYIPRYYVTISPDYYKNHEDDIRELACHRKYVSRGLRRLHGSGRNLRMLNCNWNVYGSCLGFNYPVPLRFSRRPDRVVYLGGTVLFVCLQLAMWYGFKRIILLGVDHRFGFPRSEAVYGGRRLNIEREDSIHFAKEYSKPGYAPHCDILATERSFMLALRVFENAGIEIWNATSDSGLNIIPRRRLSEII